MSKNETVAGQGVIAELEEYENKFKGKPIFYAHDISEIHDLSKGSIFDLVNNALMIGYIRGYKAGMRKGAKK